MKKNSTVLWVLIAALLIGCFVMGCENPANGKNEPSALSGDITITPNTEVTVGDELTANYSGTENVTFQWNKDGTAIADKTAAKFTPTEAGSYTVTVSAKDYKSKTSGAVEVKEAELVLSGNVTITPNTEVIVGTELTASYDGEEEVTFQWNKNGTAIDGKTAAKFTPSEVGNYTVTVSFEGYPSKTSTPVAVGLPALPGNISITGNLFAGEVLTANYSGTEEVTFQWNKDGAAIADETAATFTPAEAGSYTVTVSAEGFASKTSAAVDVALPALSGNVSITGDLFVGRELTANYDGEENVTFQWNKDDVAIDGANAAKFTPDTVGNYTVTVSAEGYESKTSTAVDVTEVMLTITGLASSDSGKEANFYVFDNAADFMNREAASVVSSVILDDSTVAKIGLAEDIEGYVLFTVGDPADGGKAYLYISAETITTPVNSNLKTYLMTNTLFATSLETVLGKFESDSIYDYFPKYDSESGASELSTNASTGALYLITKLFQI